VPVGCDVPLKEIDMTYEKRQQLETQLIECLEGGFDWQRFELAAQIERQIAEGEKVDGETAFRAEAMENAFA
jgi:hypothetical protein